MGQNKPPHFSISKYGFGGKINSKWSTRKDSILYEALPIY